MFKILSKVTMPFHNYLLCSDLGSIKPASPPPLPALPPPPSPKRVLTWKEAEVRLFDPSQPPAYLTSPPVKIVGGTHSGKKAFFIKKTKKRVMVRIEGVGERYLSPKNIKF